MNLVHRSRDNLQTLVPNQISSLLPSNKKRSMVVHSLISSLGLMTSSPFQQRRLVVVTPRKASYKDLSVYHTRDYLDAILDTGNSSKNENESEPSAEFGLEDVKYYSMPLRSF